MEVVNGVRFGTVLGLYSVEMAVYIQKVFGCSIGLLNRLYLGLFYTHITTELRPLFDRS